MSSTQEEIREGQKQRVKQTGAPHGVMKPDELIFATNKKWDSIKSSISIEDRAEFEPYLEALLGRVAVPAGQTSG